MPKIIIVLVLLMLVCTLSATTVTKYVNRPGYPLNYTTNFQLNNGIHSAIANYLTNYPNQTSTDTLRIIVCPNQSNGADVVTYFYSTYSNVWNTKARLIIEASSYPATGPNAFLFLTANTNAPLFDISVYGASGLYGKVTIAGLNIAQQDDTMPGTAIACDSRSLDVLNCSFCGIPNSSDTHPYILEYSYSEANSYNNNTALTVSYCNFSYPTLNNHCPINAVKVDPENTAYSYTANIAHCNFDKCGNGISLQDCSTCQISTNNLYNNAYSSAYTGINIKQTTLTGTTPTACTISNNEVKRFANGIVADTDCGITMNWNKIYAYLTGIDATVAGTTLYAQRNLVEMAEMSASTVLGMHFIYNYPSDTGRTTRFSNNTLYFVNNDSYSAASNGIKFEGSHFSNTSSGLANNIIRNFDAYINESSNFSTMYYTCYNGVLISEGLNSSPVGCFTTDPLFSNPGYQLFTSSYDTTNHWGFNLTEDSPCIDAGTPNTIEADGTRLDIGCFYYPQQQQNEDKGGQIEPVERIAASNYPNPFNPRTTINYTVPKAGRVKVEVFNSRGQKVRELVNEDQKPGDHTVAFEGNNLASGMYLYRIQAAGQTVSGKMIMVK